MIHETNDTFPFSKLILCKPISSSNGSFFIRYSLNEHPLYIQPPKCYIKQIHTKTGKKMYADLVFQQDNESFLQWMENLENQTQQSLYEHRQQWFKSDLEKEDIEQSFTSPMKIYKSGKEYIVRTNIPSHNGISKLKIYNEDEATVPIEDIIENTMVTVILEIQGVRSSARNFQIDIEIKQMMVMKQEDIFNSCIFSPLRKKNTQSNENIDKTESLGNIEIKTIHNLNKVNHEPIIHELINEQLINDEPINNEPINDEPINDEHINYEHINHEPINDIHENIVEEIIQKEPESFLCEVDIHLDEVSKNESISLKERKDLYYRMYEEARQKAKVARDLALSSYLEAKQIKNKYMLDDVLNSSSDDSDDSNDSDNDYK